MHPRRSSKLILLYIYASAWQGPSAVIAKIHHRERVFAVRELSTPYRDSKKVNLSVGPSCELDPGSYMNYIR